MRWNRRERTLGQLAALAVLLSGVVVVGRPGAADRLAPGMTPADVAAALGSPGRPHPTKFTFMTYEMLRPSRDEAEFQAFLARQQAFFHANSAVNRQYRLPFETVEVEFHGVKDQERVRSASSYPSLGWIDWNWPLAGWACGAAVVGLVVSEWARRRRPTPGPGQPAGYGTS